MIEHRKVSPSGLGYLEYALAETALSSAQVAPTLIFLHGLGEHGQDLDRLKAWGLPKLISEGLQVPYHVLCPQCPEGEDWNLEQIAELIETRPHGEQSPVFLTGYSRGATTAWKFAAWFGHLLAGVIPVAGRWDLADTARLADVPVLAVHGALDERPSPAPVVEAIAQRGGDAQLWLLEGQGHFISDRVYADPALYEWIARWVSDSQAHHEPFQVNPRY